MNIPAEVIDEILETAGLFLEAGADDPDAVGFRRDYGGRGYSKTGFGFTAYGSSTMPRFLVAAGLVAGRRELEGEPSFDARAFASSTYTDSMGLGMIFYWPGWVVVGTLQDEREAGD